MSALQGPGGGDRFVVMVPVKPLSSAKSRLARLGDDLRRDLAAAFAADTVSVLLDCERVARVLVVTDDHVVARSLEGLGADVIPDGTSDLNGTLVQAAAEMHRRDPSLHLAAVCADLPALRPAELTAALDAADPQRMSFVADEERVGTTAVAAPDLARFRPRFGRGSRQEHLASGAMEIEAIDVPGLRRDVDDPDDLRAALRLGVGPRTSAVATLASRRLAAVQATVSAFDPQTREGRVLMDDGVELGFPASALDGTGLRLLRPGQRLRLETTGENPPRVVAVQILTLPSS